MRTRPGPAAPWAESAMSGKQKRPRGVSSGRNFSIINPYVKGARPVNRFSAPESTPSTVAGAPALCRPFRGGFLGWLPATLDPARVDSLDSVEESTSASVDRHKPRIWRGFMRHSPRGGFRVGSPVKPPRASKMPRSAPPYTDQAREEPWQGAPPAAIAAC